MSAIAYEFGTQAVTQNNGNTRWTNLGAYTADTAETLCNNETKNQTFDTLTTFNFAGTGIIFESTVAPVITGLRFEVDRRRGTGRSDEVTDQVVQIRLNNAVIGLNKALGSNWVTTIGSAGYRVGYGADGDTWGLTAPQLASIIGQSGQYGRTINPQFGLDIQPQGRNTGFIRRIRLIVFFRINGVKVRTVTGWVDANPRGRSNDAWATGKSYARIDGRWVIVKAQ